ncbi:MAG: T9SS type A sorting domain-containing protein [Flavobacteriales bacterium]|nr:T9SS type A sorting domain-containing protein [Flavobacteriales bacterium]
MRRTLLAGLLIVIGSAANAQCTPNQLYADSVYGVWPDTLEGFSSGMVSVFYSDTLILLVPEEAGLIDPQFDGFVIDSVALDQVTNLPPGLAVECNSQTGAECTFLANQVGCGLIEGTPTSAGVYDMTLEVTAYTFLGFFVLPVPQTFTGYSITISEDNTSITSNISLGVAQLRNSPNPFSDRTNIEFTLRRAAQARLKVFNLVGEEVFNRIVAGKQGSNSVVLGANGLENGVYIYTVEVAGHSVTGRMVVNR